MHCICFQANRKRKIETLRKKERSLASAGEKNRGEKPKRQRDRERCRNSFYYLSINKEDSSRLGSLIYYFASDRSSLGNEENRSIRARTIDRRKERNGKNGVISRLIRDRRLREAFKKQLIIV